MLYLVSVASIIGMINITSISGKGRLVTCLLPTQLVFYFCTSGMMKLLPIPYKHFFFMVTLGFKPQAAAWPLTSDGPIPWNVTFIHPLHLCIHNFCLCCRTAQYMETHRYIINYFDHLILSQQCKYYKEQTCSDHIHKTNSHIITFPIDTCQEQRQLRMIYRKTSINKSVHYITPDFCRVWTELEYWINVCCVMGRVHICCLGYQMRPHETLWNHPAVATYV